MNQITVFTPTFNRGYTLNKLYDSLLNQSYQDFCWLIIDDGSTDNTKQIVDHFISENKISIRYIQVQNGGKHRAINKALDMVDSKLFFIVDSDDYLVRDALEKIIKWESTISEENIAGVVGLKSTSEDKVLGTTFNGECLDILIFDRIKNNIAGDKAEIFYTEILKKYRFPEIEGEIFLTEAVVWNQMALDGYKLRYFNEILYKCDYLNDGLTKNIEDVYRKNLQGFLMYIKQLIAIHKNNVFDKIKYCSYYHTIAKDKFSKKEISKQLGISTLFLMISNVTRKIVKH